MFFLLHGGLVFQSDLLILTITPMPQLPNALIAVAPRNFSSQFGRSPYHLGLGFSTHGHMSPVWDFKEAKIIILLCAGCEVDRVEEPSANAREPEVGTAGGQRSHGTARRAACPSGRRSPSGCSEDVGGDDGVSLYGSGYCRKVGMPLHGHARARGRAPRLSFHCVRSVLLRFLPQCSLQILSSFLAISCTYNMSIPRTLGFSAVAWVVGH